MCTYSQSQKGTWKMTMTDLIAKGFLLSSDFNRVTQYTSQQ